MPYTPLPNYPYPGSEFGNDVEAVNNIMGGLVNHEDRLAPLESVVQNTQTGTSYSLILTDAGKVVEMNNAGANTVTVPPNSSVAFPVGTIVGIYRMGAGSTTVQQGSGVTVRNAGSLRAQFSEASLRKRAADEWVLSGDLT